MALRKITLFLAVALAVLGSIYAYRWIRIYTVSRFDYSHLPPGLYVSHGPPFHEEPPWYLRYSYYYGHEFHPSIIFYRTEVKNTTDQAIRITSIAAFEQRDGEWTQVRTVRGMNPTGKDFADWFGRDTIEPGGIAVCYTNYSIPGIEWAYEGIDQSGRTYRAAAVVKRPRE